MIYDEEEQDALDTAVGKSWRLAVEIQEAAMHHIREHNTMYERKVWKCRQLLAEIEEELSVLHSEPTPNAAK